MAGKTQKFYNKNKGSRLKKLLYDLKYQKSGYGRMSNILRKRARRKKEEEGSVNGDVEHIIPLSKGGSNADSNLTVMDPSENRAKDRPTKNKSKATAKILTT